MTSKTSTSVRSERPADTKRAKRQARKSKDSVAPKVGDGSAESPGRQQRRRAGEEVRERVSHASLGVWAPPADRRGPVQILRAQDAQRVQHLVPIRYARMLSSPFAFYRGGAAIMASDLSYSPSTHLTVQLAGDAHLANFGGYASPERTFVFDLNDFDETLPGPFEYDVKRLVASFEVAGRQRGFRQKKRRKMVKSVVAEYRRAVIDFSHKPRMDVWYAHLTADDILEQYGRELGPAAVANFHQLIAKAQRRTSDRALDRLTRQVDGEYRFVRRPPYLVPASDMVSEEEAGQVHRALQQAMTGYRRSLQSDRRFLISGYRVVHVAHKVVGVGSVGTRCWVALLLADQDESDVLVLQMKEANQSVLEPYVGDSRTSQHGQRVVEGQRIMQASGDVLLGWTRVHAPDGQTREFYVRQLWDWKESAALDTMPLDTMMVYAKMCAWTLARAHCRSGDRVALAGYLADGEPLDDALADFASTYADQNEADFAEVQQAAHDGLIEVAESGW